MKRIILSFVFSLLICFVIFMSPVIAQDPESNFNEEILEAKIIKIIEEKKIEVMESTQDYQKLELQITKGSLKDSNIIIENGNIPIVNPQRYRVGDRVMVSFSKNLENNDQFYITDFIRRDSLLLLLIAFIVLTIVVSRRQGVTSILGMAISFLIIFVFILPQIYKGGNPILIAIIGSIFIIPVTFYLSHGFNKKTTVAVISTLISLIITATLAGVFVELARLTGFVTEESGFLQSARPGIVNIKGLLLAGIIIGALGVLDDITISQASVVQELKTTDPKLKPQQLYLKAMKVGQDHISSMINTLVLVYTGASLPLLLLFIDNPRPFSEVVNYEIFADEAVRTLVGSIGLILAVPITTIIASLAFTSNKK